MEALTLSGLQETDMIKPEDGKSENGKLLTEDGGSDPERTLRLNRSRLNGPKLTRRKLIAVPDREQEIRNRRQKVSKDHDGGSDPERTLRPNFSRAN